MKKAFLIFCIAFSMTLLTNCVSTPKEPINSSCSSLRLPESYSDSYHYRTNTPEKNIPAILKSEYFESLRKNSTEVYIEKVCKSISDSAKNDFEKVKMIHDFIILLLYHDPIHFLQDYYSDEFADIFKNFCDRLDIPCKKVHGYIRQKGIININSILNEQEPLIPNHTWNIVEIYKAWYIVDCTWDSFYGRPIDPRYTTDITEKKYSYINYSTDCLFLRGEHCIYSHFPLESEYQLIPQKISPTEFIKLPYLAPDFFYLFKDYEPFEKINEVENSFTLSLIPYNEESVISIGVTNPETREDVKNCFCIKSINSKREIQFSFPKPSIYEINIFLVNMRFESAPLTVEFFVDAKSSNSIRYPTFWHSFAKNFEIMSPSPIEEPLKKGQSYTFKIHIENTNFVFATDDETSFPLKNEGNGIFTLDITIPTTADKLDLVYETYNKEYEALVTYKVE